MESSAVSYVIVAIAVIVILGLAGGVTFAVFLSIAATKKRNDAFLAKALAWRDLAPGVVVHAPFTTAPGAHGVWLDLSISGPNEQLAFELWLSVKVGPTTLLEGSYPVTVNDEGDAKGLPNPFGVSAISSTDSVTLGKQTMTSVLRAFRFDAPPSSPAEVRARIAYGPGVTAQRARLLVTPGDAP